MRTAPPTPPDTDAAAFMAALRRLKAWSDLSYRQLERRAADAGHVLPYSTAATMLGKNRLPRQELIAAFVAACGLHADEAQEWIDARTAIACGHADPSPARNQRSRRSRWALAGAAALAAALLTGAALGGAFTETQDIQQTQTSSGARPQGFPPTTSSISTVQPTMNQ